MNAHKKDTHIRFDWVCKRLFRSKADFKILEGFLSELLKFDVKIAEVLESEANKRLEYDKFNRVDILAKNEAGDLFLIEVQNESELDFFQRMAYGASRLILDFLKEGAEYSEIKKVYSINILYFDLGQGDDYVYHGRYDFKGIHNHDHLQLSHRQKATFKVIEPGDLLPEFFVLKINNFNDIAKDGLDAWIYYLKNNQVAKNVEAKGMQEVEKHLTIESMSAEERANYIIFLENRRSERMAIFTAKDEGIAEGKIEGEKLKAIEIAKEMKADGFDIAKIIKLTKLSQAEIKDL